MGTAQRALAISHYRQVVLRAGHPPQRAKLTERDVVTTSGVRCLGCGLADDRQSGGPASRRLGVGVCQLGIFIHEPPSHHKMRGNDLGKLLGQAPQLRTYRRV